MTSQYSGEALEPGPSAWLVGCSQRDIGHPLTVRFRVTPSPHCCSPHCGGAKASIKLFQICAITDQLMNEIWEKKPKDDR